MLEVSVELEQIRLFQEHIEQLEEAIEKNIWFSEPIKLLQKVPGIGQVTAWTIVSEIGDPKRFHTDRQFTS